MPPFAAPQVDNRARFEQLLRPQLDALYANGLRLTHSPSDAQDLVQETVLRAYRFFDRFESGTNFKAWLLRIQYNAFVNDYRRRGLERQVRHTLEEEGRGGGVMSRQALASLSDPEGQALRPLLAAELSEALAELPEDQQQMVLLADVEELKYKEIAEIVGSPIGTVMSKLHRARRALRRQLLERAARGERPSQPAQQVQGPSAEGVAVDETPVSLERYRRKRGEAS